MANTTKGYPYPIDTDQADVPSDVQLLAEAVDGSPGVSSLTQTQINALTVAEKWAGRIVWNQTTSKHQRSDGSAFSDLPSALSTATPGATSSTGAAGTSGDASRADHVHALGAHKSTHATGGSDALAASDIGAATSGHAHAGTYDPAGTAASAVAAHEIDTTNVHGIADTSALVLTSDSRLTNTRTPTDGSVTDAKVAAGAAIAQSKISGLTTDLAAKAALASPALTGTPTVNGTAITALAGLQIVAPSSIANSGGSASASGGEVTFTGVTSVSLNGVFSSTFDNYLVVIDYTAAVGANAATRFRLRAAGVDAATNYSSALLQFGAGGATGYGDPLGTTYTEAGIVDATNAADSAVQHTIYRPFLATRTVLVGSGYFRNSAGSPIGQCFGATHTTASSYDGLTLSTAGSSITGKIRVYGFKNS